MSNKNSFAKKFCSLTEIGQAFNLSAVAVGKELNRLGYRDEDGKPTSDTLENGIAVHTPLAGGRDYYRWNKKKVHEILEPHHKRDFNAKTRTKLKEILRIVSSQEYEMGGGLLFKAAEYELFEVISTLPLQDSKELREVLRLIEELKGKQEDKIHIKNCVLHYVAKIETLTKDQVELFFEIGDWLLMRIISENDSIDTDLRQQAEKRYRAEAPIPKI